MGWRLCPRRPCSVFAPLLAGYCCVLYPRGHFPSRKILVTEQVAFRLSPESFYFTSPPVAPSLPRSPAGCPPCRRLGRRPTVCGRYRSWRKLSRPESRPGFVRAGPHSLTDPLPCTAGSVYPLSFGRYVSDAVPPGRRAFAPPNIDPLLLLHPYSRGAFFAGSDNERTAARQASRVRVSLRRLRRGRTCGPLFLALRFCPALPPAWPQSVYAAVRRRLSKTREVPCGGYGARSLRLPPPCRIARSEPGGGISADPPALPALFRPPLPPAVAA